MTVFACQSSDHSIKKVREKKILKENPFFNQDQFFPISLSRSCLCLLETALHFNKNFWIYFWWQILTYVLSICCIIWEKNSTFLKKTCKKSNFSQKIDVLSIICFPLTFSILWSELWHAKTVTYYQYSLKISGFFSKRFRSYKGFAFYSPIRRRCSY